VSPYLHPIGEQPPAKIRWHCKCWIKFPQKCWRKNSHLTGSAISRNID
jgi:hypothetical protein